MRGTFANIRLRNQVAPGHRGRMDAPPAGRRADDDLRRGDAVPRRAACRCSSSPGKEYGSGSSRDWAAKGTLLLGVRAVIARELRADPPQQPREHGRAAAAVQGRGVGREPRASTGTESFDVDGHRRRPRADGGRRVDGARRRRQAVSFTATARIDTPEELAAFKAGGILPYVLRQLVDGR